MDHDKLDDTVRRVRDKIAAADLDHVNTGRLTLSVDDVHTLIKAAQKVQHDAQS